MKISRAAFLKSCAVALAGAFAESATLQWNLFGTERLRLDEVRASFFQKYLNDPFIVTVGEHRARLVLTKIDEPPVTRRVEQFSLIFHGAPGDALRDGTHAFQHPSLGKFEMFIVAIGVPNDRRRAYQACFSRHRKTPPAEPRDV